MIQTEANPYLTTYTGTRQALIAAGLVTAGQLPAKGKNRLAKYRGYPAGKAKNNGGGLEWVVHRDSKGFAISYTNRYLDFWPHHAS